MKGYSDMIRNNNVIIESKCLGLILRLTYKTRSSKTEVIGTVGTVGTAITH